MSEELGIDITPARLYLDDLVVGQRFRTGTCVVTEEAISAFASAFDPQPFHLDDAAARKTMFAGLAASGWHTAAIAMRLMVDLGFLADGLVGLGGEIAWPRPTRAGDVLHVLGEIVEISPSRSRSDRGIVTIRNDTCNQRDEIVQQFSGRLLVFRRPAKVLEG